MCNRPKTYFFLFLLLLCIGCAEEDASTGTKACDCEKRTLVAYLAGDNSLAMEAGLRSDSILAGWQPDYGPLIIIQDSWQTQGPVLLKAVWKNGRAVADTLRRYTQEPNMSWPMLWRRVLADVAFLAPSDYYGLIVFSHATGWLPEGAYEQRTAWKPATQTRSLIEGNGQQMELQDFAEAIPNGMFDFMVFDMCFMASVEACYALRDKTEWIVASASEMVSPGFMPIYHRYLRKLYQREPDLQGFAKAYFDYFMQQQGQMQSALVSVVNTQALTEVASIAKALQQQSFKGNVSDLQYFDRKGSPHLFFDLADYLHALDDTGVYATQIDNAMNDAVRFKRNTDKLLNIDIRKHSGLSVYIPQANLPYINMAYKDTQWWKDCN